MSDLDSLYRAKQYQSRTPQRSNYNSPNNTPMQSSAPAYGGDSFTQFYQMGENARKIYDNAMARRHDGWYKGNFNSQSMGSKTMSDMQAAGSIDPKLYDAAANADWSTSVSVSAQPNAAINSANAITSGGGNLAGGLNLTADSVNGALTSGLTSGSQAVGGLGATGGISAGIGGDAALAGLTDGALAANSAAIAGGAAEGAAIGSGVTAGLGTAAAEGTAAAGAGAAGAAGAAPALAAAAPWVVGGLGVYGLGKWLDWW